AADPAGVGGSVEAATGDWAGTDADGGAAQPTRIAMTQIVIKTRAIRFLPSRGADTGPTPLPGASFTERLGRRHGPVTRAGPSRASLSGGGSEVDDDEMSQPAAPNRSLSIVDLATLLYLGAVWGAVFVFMRIAAPEVGPVWAAETRLAIGSAVLVAIAG